MQLVRMEPFRELTTMREVLNRLWDDTYYRPFRFAAVNGGATQPAIDISETNDEVLVKAVMPGVKPEDVDININGNTLTIKGETREEHEDKDGKFYHRECYYGNFSRSLTIPAGLKADEAEANLENGVLTLSIPKAEEVKPKTIKVKAKHLADSKKAETKS